jgi:hypothetical protein
MHPLRVPAQHIPKDMTPEEAAELAIYLICNKGGDVLHPAQVLFGLEMTPRSAGKDLLVLTYHMQGLRADKDDCWGAYGVCERLDSFDIEKRCYKLFAYQFERLCRESGVRYGHAMPYRLSALMLAELTTQPTCTACNSAGCEVCEGTGKVCWPKTRRILFIETTQKNWTKHLGKMYVGCVLPMAAGQMREAARVFLRVVCDLFPERMRDVLLEFKTRNV